ncbi:hypothetical protein [Sorangium sp. So ce1097]|uniref:hypothetical protein n=1 Tax=Sorangium sp. So ce1097 TaxID=3133330 RepID=UPI003F635452
MGWRSLQPTGRFLREEDLQKYFAHERRRDGWRAAGIPAWFAELKVKAADHAKETGLGYSYRPDLICFKGARSYVVELKHADKFEPLGLAEVLHHAWMLSSGGMTSARPDHGQHIPVLVTQHSQWLRASLSYMFQNGFRRDAIRHVELTLLRDGNQTLVWFDDVTADWVECDVSDVPYHDLLLAPGIQWLQVTDADTWIGVNNKLQERPLLWRVPYVMVSRLEGPQDEVLVWQGGPIGTGTYHLGSRAGGHGCLPITLGACQR